MNPTQDALEQRIAALDGGIASLAVSSGQAASAMAIQNLAGAGDNVISPQIFMAARNSFANTLKQQG